jgi:hypothetical protein
MKDSTDPHSGIEPATFRLVAQYLNHLRHRTEHKALCYAVFSTPLLHPHSKARRMEKIKKVMAKQVSAGAKQDG